MLFRLMLIPLMFTVALSAGVAQEDQTAPVYRWNLTSQHTVNGSVAPVHGGRPGKIVGNLSHSRTAPGALQFDGNDAPRHRVEITDNLSTISLPDQALSVDAWVLIEQPLQ